MGAPAVSTGGQRERRTLQLGHTAGVQVLRSAGPEQRVPDGAGAIVIRRMADARHDDVDAVRNERGDLFVRSAG